MAKCYRLFPRYYWRNIYQKSCLPNNRRLKKLNLNKKRFDSRRELKRPIRLGRKRSNDELRIRKRDKSKFPDFRPEQPGGPKRTDAWKPNFQTTVRNLNRQTDFRKLRINCWERPLVGQIKRQSSIHLFHYQRNRTGENWRLFQNVVKRWNCQSP